MPKFTCPFCIREYKHKEVLYNCPDCGSTASKKSPFEAEPIKCSDSSCGGYATLRKCPSCSEIIPKTALETRNLPFSIVGISNSGKTNYITVMLHELSRYSALRLALGPQTNETREHQNENRRRIYEDHVFLESTQAGMSMPQIWHIKNLEKKKGNNVPTYTFTIFDGAGEDHSNLDPSSTECRYINASKAIILAIDPLVLPSVRRVVDPDIVRNSLAGNEGRVENIEEVINNVVTYIKTARGIGSTKILKIPVAVVLTKFDTIIDQPAFTNALVKQSGINVRDKKIVTSDIAQVDDEIKSWLIEVGEGAFVNALESHFKEFYFFGVSSYGSPPKDIYTLADRIQPHRVLDPILWLFKRENFID